MTDQDRIPEAGHHIEADPDEAKRDQHTGAENPKRVPVKDTNDPSSVDLPPADLDRETEKVPERTRRDMH